MKVFVSTITPVFLLSFPAASQSLPVHNHSSTLAQVTVPTNSVTPGVQGSPNPAVQGTPTAPPKEAGFEFEGIATPNVGRIIDTIFRGECPGEKPGDVKARFYSTGTPPAPGRRVVITNVSRGLAGNEAPFTDRNYNQGRLSESTSVQFGTSHGLRHFAVLEGQNTLEYVIKQGDSTIVEKGSFTIEMSRNERTRDRNAICQDEKYCQGSENTPLDQCQTVATRSRCYCPDSPDKKFIRR